MSRQSGDADYKMLMLQDALLARLDKSRVRRHTDVLLGSVISNKANPAKSKAAYSVRDEFVEAAIPIAVDTRLEKSNAEKRLVLSKIFSSRLYSLAHSSLHTW